MMTLILIVALGKPSFAEPVSSGIPELTPAPELSRLANRRLTRLDLSHKGKLWESAFQFKRVRLGEVYTSGLARRAMRELLDSGKFADVSARAEPDGAGVRLVLTVLPRRLIATLKLSGNPADDEETLRASQLRVGGEVTEPGLREAAARIRRFHALRGYPSARVSSEVTDTDRPMHVVVSLRVDAGPAQRIRRRRFVVSPNAKAPGLRPKLLSYEVDSGDRADEEALTKSDRQLEKKLRGAGFHRARVSHRVLPEPTGTVILEVVAEVGPLIRIRFEGNRHFDRSDLLGTLELHENEDRSPPGLAERLRAYYAERGFLDVEVTYRYIVSPEPSQAELRFEIREGGPVRIVARRYPCLTGDRSPEDVGSEIDSFLSEELPGSAIIGTVDPAGVDAVLGPRGNTGSRPRPYEPNPWQTFVPSVYERALKHVQDLYRSEGYLSATVGPAHLLRRRCHRHSPPGQCRPMGPVARPKSKCVVDEIGVPLPEPAPDLGTNCVADTRKGISCEPTARLHIPIKLGPRTTLYDIAFHGNRVFAESVLNEVAELSLGKPASQVELEKARRRLLDGYAEEGFVFAGVDVDLELSPDHTRGRARFYVNARERVVVSDIVIVGARRTNESLIRSRIALKEGEAYRRSLVRKTEERLATLGVFSTVTVGLEDPYIPAKRKVVVITVKERVPQHVEGRPGFSTGEGFRFTFEYGHRNLGGEAIQFTLRLQLGYLPNALILEPDVRDKYDELNVGQRLERRNSARVEFPEIGLGPLFRLSVEGIDVRDNARDFGITKDAGIVTLIFRPVREFSATFGGSLERNSAEIFGETQKGALEEYVKNNPRSRNTFRVPEGTTIAVAERAGIAWDRRDNPLGATRGTLLSASVEHVRATPVDDEEGPGTPSVFAATTSQFLRFENRLAGYLRLSDKGLALALSFRWGLNQQLIDNSQTYPDRLFFLGGVDSLRGFLQDSVVPEDIAQRLLDPASGLTLREVVIRGGDAFINPRAELRIPLTEAVKTAIFLDAGNLWRKPELIDPSKLRFSTGSGIRVDTPVGPLAFDYGFNIDRVLDEFYPQRGRQRFWEDVGAFHFSIGLF